MNGHSSPITEIFQSAERQPDRVLRKAGLDDLDTLAGLAFQMWDSHTLEELKEEFASIIKKGEAAGFAQCQLRHDYVEGTDTSPVGYLEGIFVVPERRGQGLASELLRACEDWALKMGCSQFASDCELHNTGSLAFHLKLGFHEAGRIICFAKKLK